MEQNEEHIMMNILIYHAHETELRTQSYGMMNIAPECKNIRDLDEKTGVNLVGSISGAESEDRRRWRSWRSPTLADEEGSPEMAGDSTRVA